MDDKSPTTPEADEVCSRCGVVFKSEQHFIRCDASPCPMSTGKTFLDYLEEARTDAE